MRGNKNQILKSSHFFSSFCGKISLFRFFSVSSIFAIKRRKFESFRKIFSSIYTRLTLQRTLENEKKRKRKSIFYQNPHSIVFLSRFLVQTQKKTLTWRFPCFRWFSLLNFPQYLKWEKQKIFSEGLKLLKNTFYNGIYYFHAWLDSQQTKQMSEVLFFVDFREGENREISNIANLSLENDFGDFFGWEIPWNQKNAKIERFINVSTIFGKFMQWREPCELSKNNIKR